MPTPTIRHVTTYRYRQPVAFGEHRMMLRPRDASDQRVLEASIEISPKPKSLRFVQDDFGNHLGIARFSGRSKELSFESTVCVEHSPPNVAGLEIEETKCFAAGVGQAVLRGTCSTRSSGGNRYCAKSFISPTGGYKLSQCCEPSSEERSAGKPHATFCGNRRWATTSGDPVLGVKFPGPCMGLLLSRPQIWLHCFSFLIFVFVFVFRGAGWRACGPPPDDCSSGLRDNQRGNPPACAALGRDTTLYSVAPCETHHDAVIRIVSEVPRRRPHSTRRPLKPLPRSEYRHLGSSSAARHVNAVGGRDGYSKRLTLRLLAAGRNLRGFHLSSPSATGR